MSKRILLNSINLPDDILNYIDEYIGHTIDIKNKTFNRKPINICHFIEILFYKYNYIFPFENFYTNDEIKFVNDLTKNKNICDFLKEIQLVNFNKLELNYQWKNNKNYQFKNSVSLFFLIKILNCSIGMRFKLELEPRFNYYILIVKKIEKL